MKKILTILMFAAVLGLVMGSVSAADLQAHDFNGQFTLDVPGNYWMANAGAEGHQYEDGHGIIIQYLTLNDIKSGTFADYLNSQGLKDGKIDDNFTVFQKDGKYVVVTNSSSEMYIITDKNLDEAKAIAASASLGTGTTNANETVTPTNTTAELESHDFGGKFKMNVPKGASFMEVNDSEAKYNGGVIYSDSSNDLNITYVENNEIDNHSVDEIISNLEKETGAKVTKNGNLNVVSAGPWNEVIFNDGNKMVMIVTSQLDLDTVTSMAQSVEFAK